MSHPVHYHVERPLRFDRLQLLIRLVAFCALGVLGLSFGTIMLFGIIGLPALAAIRLTSRPPSEYLSHDGPRITAGLRWFAVISAWTGLTADRVDGSEDTIVLDLPCTATRLTPQSAILRAFTGLPSALVLAVLGFIGVFVWVWAALSILFTRRVGATAHEYLVGLQRWSIRLLAYQASLVDEYPPFSFDDSPALPTAKVMV